jgi:hypothetical protein
MTSKRISRRELLVRGAVGAGGMFALPGVLLRAAPVVAAPSFVKVPHFTVPLPIPVKATPVGAEHLPHNPASDAADSAPAAG